MNNITCMSDYVARRMTRAERYIDAIGAEVRFDSEDYAGPISAMTDKQFSSAWAALDLIDDLLGDPLSGAVMRVQLLGDRLSVTLDLDYVRFCAEKAPGPVRDWCDSDGRCYSVIRFFAQQRAAV